MISKFEGSQEDKKNLLPHISAALKLISASTLLLKAETMYVEMIEVLVRAQTLSTMEVKFWCLGREAGWTF